MFHLTPLVGSRPSLRGCNRFPKGTRTSQRNDSDKAIEIVMFASRLLHTDAAYRAYRWLTRLPASLSTTCLVRFESNTKDLGRGQLGRQAGRPARACADRTELLQDGQIVGRRRPAIQLLRRKLRGRRSADMVEVLGAVLTDGLPAVEAA